MMTLDTYETPTYADRSRATSLKHWPLLEKLLAEGKVKPHPVRMLPKGLEGIEEGLVQLRDMKVSGCKLVARIGET